MGMTKKILVVDDDTVNRFFLSKVLEKNGCMVTSAKDGHEALHAFDKNQFDIVFIDYYMPIMNGIELAKKIRDMANSKKQRSHLIMTTGLDSNDNLISDLLLGEVDRVLYKPRDRDEIVSIVNSN